MGWTRHSHACAYSCAGGQATLPAGEHGPRPACACQSAVPWCLNGAAPAPFRGSTNGASKQGSKQGAGLDACRGWPSSPAHACECTPLRWRPFNGRRCWAKGLHGVRERRTPAECRERGAVQPLLYSPKGGERGGEGGHARWPSTGDKEWRALGMQEYGLPHHSPGATASPSVHAGSEAGMGRPAGDMQRATKGAGKPDRRGVQGRGLWGGAMPPPQGSLGTLSSLGGACLALTVRVP